MGAMSYERLSVSGTAESRRNGGGGAWAAVRRALARLCLARRQGRWAAARSRTLVRARGRRHAGSVAAGCGYDSEGYARNFDDGLWKAEEEGAPWSANAAGRPSLGACRLARAVSAAH
uniref:Uncharacterized protein n=1 Tax=Avena sativa TaxID=4498 RepID=A0ACD5YED6_AVESA